MQYIYYILKAKKVQLLYDRTFVRQSANVTESFDHLSAYYSTDHFVYYIGISDYLTETHLLPKFKISKQTSRDCAIFGRNWASLTDLVQKIVFTYIFNQSQNKAGLLFCDWLKQVAAYGFPPANCLTSVRSCKIQMFSATLFLSASNFYLDSKVQILCMRRPQNLKTSLGHFKKNYLAT